MSEAQIKEEAKEFANACDIIRKETILEEMKLLEKLINEKKVDRISNNEYNITIEVVAFENIKKHIEERRELVK